MKTLSRPNFAFNSYRSEHEINHVVQESSNLLNCLREYFAKQKENRQNCKLIDLKRSPLRIR